MGASCKQLCKRVKMPKPKKTGGFYANGYKLCTYCEYWVLPNILKEKGYGVIRCFCCGLVYKSRPNKRSRKEKLAKIKEMA